MKYPESEIRRACRKWGVTPGVEESIIRDLQDRNLALADTDTVTVKELRDAQERLRQPGYPSTVYPSTVYPVAKLLKEVVRYREVLEAEPPW